METGECRKPGDTTSAAWKASHWRRPIFTANYETAARIFINLFVKKNRRRCRKFCKFPPGRELGVGGWVRLKAGACKKLEQIPPVWSRFVQALVLSFTSLGFATGYKFVPSATSYCEWVSSGFCPLRGWPWEEFRDLRPMGLWDTGCRIIGTSRRRVETSNMRHALSSAWMTATASCGGLETGIIASLDRKYTGRYNTMSGSSGRVASLRFHTYLLEKKRELQAASTSGR